MAKKKRGRSAAFMRSINPHLRRNHSHKRGTQRMAKRRRSSSRRSSSGGMSAMQIAIGAGAYGAARQYIQSAISPATAMIPLGNIAPEVTMFAVGYFVQKKASSSMVKNIARAAMIVEASRVGEKLVNGQAF